MLNKGSFSASFANMKRGHGAGADADASGGCVSMLLPGDGSMPVKANDYSTVHVDQWGDGRFILPGIAWDHDSSLVLCVSS